MLYLSSLRRGLFVCYLHSVVRAGLFFILVVLTLTLIIPVNVAESGPDPWTLQYENALYKYLTNNFFEASGDFNQLLQTAKKNQVENPLHFLILSLSAMNQRKEVLQKLKIYRKSTRPETLFEASEKFYEWGNYEAANEILKISERKPLNAEQSDRQSFLRGKTLIQLEESIKRPLEYLNNVTEKSELYIPARSLKARLLFRDREFKLAASVLEALLTKIDKKLLPAGQGEADAESIKLLLGKIYFEEREFNKAEALFKTVRAEGHRYSALSGLHWVYFKAGRFMEAMKPLMDIRRDYKERFLRDGLLINLAFSAYYAENYQQAEALFKELTVWMNARKRAMEKILAEGDESPVISLSVVKGFFSNGGNPPVRAAEELQSFKADREISGSYENRLILARLAEAGSGRIRKSSDLKMTYQMEFGALDSFVKNFDKRVERLDSLYEKLKKEVGRLNFKVGGTVHNKNYFKEWFESNLSELSQGKMNQLTEFEKKIVQMFTHEIMYRQKVDSDFITKIVANKKSLENLHSLAATEWPEKIKKILSDYALGLKELDQIEIIINRLKDINAEVRSLGKGLIKRSVASVKKEAFRILVEQEIIEDDVKMAYAETREALLKASALGNTEKHR